MSCNVVQLRCSDLRSQGVVSLTFRELSKIISRKYTTPEITFTVRISSWNFVRGPKAMLWAHVQSFSLKFSSQVLFLQYTNFERIFWRARETLVKQPPGPSCGVTLMERIGINAPEACFVSYTRLIWQQSQHFVDLPIIEEHTLRLTLHQVYLLLDTFCK